MPNNGLTLLRLTLVCDSFPCCRRRRSCVFGAPPPGVHAMFLLLDCEFARPISYQSYRSIQDLQATVCGHLLVDGRHAGRLLSGGGCSKAYLKWMQRHASLPCLCVRFFDYNGAEAACEALRAAKGQQQGARTCSVPGRWAYAHARAV